MSYHSSLRVAFVPDLGKPLDAQLLHLSASEREQAKALPTERRRRQYVIGRLAAFEAIRQLLETRMPVSSLEILSEPEHGPRVSVNGISDRVSISISHSSRLAVACAWLDHSRDLDSAGVDLEYLRQNEVAESTYAFSRREQKLLLQTPEGPETAALAAWTTKEAVWKALLAGQEIGPSAIEIQRQSLAKGHSAVRVKGQLSKRLGNSELQVRMGRVEGPDGAYVFSVALVIPPGPSQLMTNRLFKLSEEKMCHMTTSAEIML
jgi:phosphopantetheinyl transferase